MLAARFYARKDVTEEQFISFIGWAEGTLITPTASTSTAIAPHTFLAAGLLHFLCTFVKSSTRQSLTSVIFSKLYNLSSLFRPGAASTSDVDTKSPLIRRLVAKYHGYLASAYLPPVPACGHGRRATTRSASLMGMPVEQTGLTNTQEEGDLDVPEEVEVLVGDLLEMLPDQDSRVRWTVAKALARIGTQLPLSFVDQITAALLDMYRPNIVSLGKPDEDLSLVSAAAWHGVTLCLASFLRNTLLSASQIGECLPWILRCLTFSQRKGTQRIGSNVRDASCYFVWCVARASSKQNDLLSEQAVRSIASKLVVVACTDEEVSVRRAASAAYQELVGRVSSVPHGLEVLVLMDVINVGGRRSAFLEAAPAIARFGFYKRALLEHMQKATLKHADVQMRQLAALSLATILANFEPDMQTAAERAVASLPSLKQAAPVHGQLLLLSELAQRTASISLRDAMFRSLADVPQSFASGASIALLLPTIASVICNCVVARPLGEPAEVDHKMVWRRFIETAQKRPEQSSHEAAARIIGAISAHFDCLADLKATLRTLKITSSIVAEQCVTRMLGDFEFSPSSTCRELLDIVVDRLSKLLDPKNTPSYKSIDAKRNALNSLGRIAVQYSQDNKVDINGIIELLEAGTDDYTFDERGDVGASLRATSFERLTDLANTSHQEPREDGTRYAELVERLVHALLKQSCERMDNVRERAGACLERLRTAQVAKIPAILPDWRSLPVALVYTLDLLPTLARPDRPLAGVVTVSGSPPEINLAGTPIVIDWIKATIQAGNKGIEPIQCLIRLVKTPSQSNRVIIPTLHLLATMLEEGIPLAEIELDDIATISEQSALSSKVKGRILAGARLYVPAFLVWPYLMHADQLSKHDSPI